MFTIRIDIYTHKWYNYNKDMMRSYVRSRLRIADDTEGCERDMSGSLSGLIPGGEVKSRIRAMAAEISQDYADLVSEENPLLLLCTLRGAVFFAADLVRCLTIPARLDFIKVHSYEGTRAAGMPVFDLGEGIDTAGKQVLILEDIVDTGRTMEAVLAHYRAQGAAGIRICTMLDKKERRLPECQQIQPEYIGFDIPDLFVVGWGLDYNDRFRLLPDIMVYDP